MKVVVESPESGRVVGIAMDFPFDESSVSCSLPRVPPRLRRRLSESRTASPPSIEEIEAKLREADLRRKKYYENLSSKARPKSRSPSQTLFHEDDLGQRLEARLQAAEQKRLSMLEKAQMRLAKLDELRQAAKTELEMRLKKERAELGSKVESRVQQAEANRMLILKAYRQKRASVKERTSQSLLRRLARESKYKESVRAAICQKRAAAEKKRLGLLEAEKRRAQSRAQKVGKIAESLSHQREIERRRMKDKLEHRLQRAKRQRAEYLMQKGRQHSPVHFNCKIVHQQADFLSWKLARCWRQFLKQNRTSFNLAKAYDAMNISERVVKSMPFEQLAVIIESVSTLQTTKALLDRLENRYKFSLVTSTDFSGWDDIDHLLRRVVSPKRRTTPRKSTPGRDEKKLTSSRKAGKTAIKLSRYQVRIVLCAYMILGHPDAVFSDQGERESDLRKSAKKFVQEFELLIKIILYGPIQSSVEESDPLFYRRLTFSSQLAAFDAAWCSYLNSFVVWKVKDAESLEDDLIRASCQLELSMVQTCKMSREGESSSLTHDMKAVQKQVTEDQKLLRQKVLYLSGDAGIQRLESALTDTRTKYFQAKDNGSPIGLTVVDSLSRMPSSSVPSSTASRVGNNTFEDTNGSCPVIQSLFKGNAVFQSENVFAASGKRSDSKFLNSDDKFSMENEFVVNELVHGQNHSFPWSSNNSDKDQNNIQAKVKETMEKLFWDDIVQSVKQDEPNYNRIVELMKEVRDGITEMAPSNWKQEIVEAIDLEIISQLMFSGELDMTYLEKMLEFALITLRKLSAPAKESELKTAHQIFLKQLAHTLDGSSGSHILALIRGLRFVLEQIQELKQEISIARIRMLGPLLKGPAGFEYLEKAFNKCYGPASNASTSLPLTTLWLVSVSASKDQEWDEHKNAFSELQESDSSSKTHFPPTILKTGVNVSVKTSGNQDAFVMNAAGAAADGRRECKGEKIDLLVRLGLLKLVSRISGLTREELPETLKLNTFRLRSAQAHVQKIIVIATSILVLRQTLLSEHIVSNSVDLENVVSDCVRGLSKLLDVNGDVGAEEIIEVLSKVAEVDENKYIDASKVQSRKDVMSRMLTKSLHDEDRVFVRVSRAVYMAVRGVVLGGSGATGRKLAEMALRKVGAAILTDRVVETASVLLVVASVSQVVHGPWYAHLVESM